jgi:hypothetical protein
MFRSLGVLSLLAFASSVLAFSQAAPSLTAVSTTPAGSSSPVAFVYVSASHGSNTYDVSGFAAAPTGELSPLPGSPFPANVQSMSVNNHYLFGTNGIDIDSFTISSDGALTQVATINAQNFNQSDCGGPEGVFLDRTGATLYDPDYLGNLCANNAYQSFRIDAKTGALTYLGAAVASPSFNSPLSFVGSNLYGYNSSCYHFFPSIYGYMRNSDETLTQLNINPAIPAAPVGDFYCPSLAASDSANHIAIPLAPLNATTWQPTGLPQLAVYSANSAGNLITHSTTADMPKTAVASVNDLRVSPSSKLLAVAGASGLQIFHLNGAGPVTHYSGLLTNDPIDHVFWDNTNHLYAMSISAGKLFVFTITSTSISRSPGSPYSVVNPQNIVVLPKR